MRSLLRDALCGLGAYARSFAPEFQLVAVVAPTMTVEQALKVGRLVPRIEAPEVRAGAAASLDPILQGAGPRELAGIPIGSLERYLPSIDQAAALDAIAVMTEDGERGENLKALAPRLRPELLPVAEQIIDAMSGRGFASRALCALAVRSAQLGDPADAHRIALKSEWPALGIAPASRYVSPVVRAAWIAEAIHLADSGAMSSWITHEARLEIVRVLAAFQHVDQAFGVVLQMEYESFVEDALCSIVRLGGPATDERAIEIAKERLDRGGRTNVLAVAARGASEPARSRLLDQAVSSALSLEGEWARVRALGPLLLDADEGRRDFLIERLVTDAVSAHASSAWIDLLKEGRWSENLLGAEPNSVDESIVATVRQLLVELGDDARAVVDEYIEKLQSRVMEVGDGAAPEDADVPLHVVRERNGHEQQPAEGRSVNMGFAPRDDPDSPIRSTSSLQVGAEYWFWVQVGTPDELAINEQPVELPSSPADARISVFLRYVPDGFELQAESCRGDLMLTSDAQVQVTRMVAGSEDLPTGRLTSCLFFPVRAPAVPGSARLGCDIYSRGLLLQSHSVDARVTVAPETAPRSLRSYATYLISTVEPTRVQELPEHSAAIMVVPDGLDSSTITIASGAAELEVTTFTISDTELKRVVEQTRGALREVSWGDREEWSPQTMHYRYSIEVDEHQLADDLGTLALNGSRLHSMLSQRSTRPPGESSFDEDDRLVRVLRGRHLVQLALRGRPGRALPLAVLYDYPLDTGATSFSLCETFLRDFRQGLVESGACCRGECPQSRSNVMANMICPGGFWGFRLSLGLPVNLGPAPDVPVTLDRPTSPAVMGVATDLAQLEEHRAALEDVFRASGLRYEDTREGLISSLLEEQPEVVYFFCHGGERGIYPYLRVGARDSMAITTDFMFKRRVAWPESRPVVFINGCHTTAMGPEKAIQWVSYFVAHASASAVVGTDITVFEDLATVFAERFFAGFVTDHLAFGEAVRSARVAVLAHGNPLGLAYVPFGMAGLAFAR